MPAMRILDSTGDTVIEWTAADPHSVDRARRAFCQLRDVERRIPFAVPRAGDVRDAVKVHSFDPADDADIVWVRAVQGG